MDTNGIKVLLVEDNAGDARFIHELLAKTDGSSYCMAWAQSLAEGIEQLRKETFDVVLVDLFLPDSRGLDTLRSIRTESPFAPLIVLTGLDDKEVAVQALQVGAQDYLLKNQIDYSTLPRAIGYAIERQRTYDTLKSLSLIDPLTGLYNRRGFITLAVQQQQLAVRTGKRLSLSFIDIDHMKRINDTLGHREGDLAITDTAAVLRQTFRSSDIIGRMGGDEFAVLCIESSPGTGENVKSRLRKNSDEYAAANPRGSSLSLSMGVVFYEPAAEDFDIEVLLAKADAVMYESKRRTNVARKSDTGIQVLVIEDNPGDARLVREMLAESRSAEFTYQWAKSLAEGRLFLADSSIDVVLLDLDLPDSWGSKTITEIVKLAPTKPIVVLTGGTSEEAGLEAIKNGAQDYLVKGSFASVTLERVINYAIERKNIVEELHKARAREMTIASRIQQMLLLGSPPHDIPGIEIGAFAIPSQYVDGDFYDFIRYGDSCVDIIQGDVMGKGIPAALLGAAAKAYFLRAHSSLMYDQRCEGLPSPEAIVTQVNSCIVDELMNLESFITLCYARLDTAARTLQFVDCGHTKTVYYCAAEGRCRLLDGVNMPLGFSRQDVYKTTTVPFAEGDLFLFYSDGLTEARSPDGGFFGEERIMEIIVQNACLAVDEINRMIFYAATAFTCGQNFSDDLTCVLVAIRDKKTETRGEHDLLTTTSSLKELAGIRSFVGNFCTRLAYPPMSQEGIAALELAVNEAATNIMKHSYGGSAAGRIDLEAVDYPGYVLISMRHGGLNFKRCDVAAPHFDGTAEGGFGIFIIEQSVDDVSYGSDGHGNHEIVLKKYKNKEEGEETWNCTVKL
jgi:phosphoserine phosphatase RsbU/P